MEYVSGNIFIREMAFEKAGDAVAGHTHNFDHTTYISRGSVKIESLDADGNVLKSIVKSASMGHNWVLIKDDVCHRLTALEDNSMGHCIYAHRNHQGEIVQAYDGWTPGYV
jgi:hypothetical protein